MTSQILEEAAKNIVLESGFVQKTTLTIQDNLSSSESEMDNERARFVDPFEWHELDKLKVNDQRSSKTKKQHALTARKATDARDEHVTAKERRNRIVVGALELDATRQQRHFDLILASAYNDNESNDVDDNMTLANTNHSAQT